MIAAFALDRFDENRRHFLRRSNPLEDGLLDLLDAGADIVGMNCLRPPEHMLGPMEQMRRAVDGYLACQPVAYRTPKETPDFTSLPEFPLGLDPLQLTRNEMGNYARDAREIGINYIGSCCGSVAIHVREMARALTRPTRSRGPTGPLTGSPRRSGRETLPAR